MTTAAECHQFAKEALEAAEEAKAGEERKAFIEMARTWMQAAARLEGLIEPLPETLPPEVNGPRDQEPRP